MATRLERPLTKIAGPFNGPVCIGQFDDGTLCIAGPNDEPVLIRNGGVMKITEKLPNGDLFFNYFNIKDLTPVRDE
jgi:hypothetical protein